MSDIRIPILDLTPEIEALWDDLNAAIQEVLRSGQFIMGPNVRALEQEIAAYLNVKHAIAVNSGTDALVIGLRAAGIGQGDEVITTPFTFFATAEAISHVGATPVFADVDERTYNIDPVEIEKHITRRTKAILPVHLYGLPCRMDAIMDLGNTYGLKVIEDCAQAFGASFKGKKVGAIGDVGCFSFFPTKNLGAYGDGGMIVTNNDEIADLARMLRSHGSRRKYYNEMIGYNSRLDEIQATVLRVKLPHIDKWNEARRQVAHRYSDLLSEVDQVLVPFEAENAYHVYHQYTIRVSSVIRDSLRQKLLDKGVGTMVYYPMPIHNLPVYRPNEGNYSNSSKLSQEVLSLPIWPSINVSQQLEVVTKVSEALSELQ